MSLPFLSSLQGWWEDIRQKGHPDIKEGWPSLHTRQDLVFVLTTLAWIPMLHSAVNFDQYDYSGARVVTRLHQLETTPIALLLLYVK
jgi:hypothetical protein